MNTQASVFAVPIVESFKGRHLSVRFRLKPIVAAGTFLDKSSNESVRMIPSGAMRVRSFMCCEHYKQRFTLHIILLSIAPPCADDNIEKTKSGLSLPNTRHNYRARIRISIFDNASKTSTSFSCAGALGRNFLHSFSKMALYNRDSSGKPGIAHRRRAP